MSRIDVLGVGFDDLTMDEAVERALGFMSGRAARYACTPNPEIVMAAKKDAALRSALASADMVLADGVGVTKAAAMLGTPAESAGAGHRLRLRRDGAPGAEGRSVFLFGAKPGVAVEAAEKLKGMFPGSSSPARRTAILRTTRPSWRR